MSANECPHNGGPRPNPDPTKGPVGTWEHCRIVECECGEAKVDQYVADMVDRGVIIQRPPGA